MLEIKEKLEKLKNEKGEITYADFDQVIQPYSLSEDSINDLIVWINQNDLNISLKEEKNMTNVYFQAISAYPSLSEDEERELALKVKEGDLLAKDKFIKSNLRLVVDIAKNYSTDTISINDLIQEGNIGLIKAVEKYDPDMNVSFAHYAYYWIRKAIIEAINKAQFIVIPQRIYQQISQIKKVREQLNQQLGCEPTDQQIADELKIDVKRVEQLNSYQITMSSIDEMGEFQDLFLADNSDPFISERLSRLVSRLPQRNQEILSYYYGLNNKEPLNTQQIGEKYSLSKQRVGQIIKESLQYIKENYDK